MAAEEQEDKQLFVATCFATNNSSSDSWLIDNSCTNHMTNDLKLFKELDNGKEYRNDVFDKFCEEAGIEHQLTVTYTPQQNGVNERKNRSIMEITRCMLHEKELPKKLWAEATNTATYTDRKSTRLNSSHPSISRMPSSA